MNGKPTRATVAKKAGVSLSTVSYVLNDSRYVSPKLRKRVADAIEALNYCPDMAARSMVTKQTKILSIVANDISNSMYGDIIMAFEREAVRRGYFVNICTGQLSLQEYIKMMLARRIDGLFFASVPDKVSVKDIDVLVTNGVSIACGNYLLPDEARVNRVEFDYHSGVKQALEHFAAQGHTKIAYLNGMEEGNPLDDKCKAFREISLQMFGEANPCIEYGYGANRLTDVEGREIVRRLLEHYPDVTAILCYSDLMAFGAMQGIHDAGKSVPDDVSVIGFENQMASKFTNPPLSSIAFDAAEFSGRVIDILIEHFKTGEAKSALVPMHLVERESVRKIQGA